MPDVVADDLERELGVDEPLHTGVAQRVRPGPGDGDARAVQIIGRSTGDGRGGQGHRGRQDPKEDTSVGRLRPAVLKVLHERRADGRRQGVGRRMASFTLGDPQSITLPVEIVHPQGGDLAPAKPVGDQQEENGIVALPGGRTPVHRLQHPADLVPRDRARDRGQPVDARGLDTGAQIFADHLVAIQIAEKHAQDAAQISHARPAESSAALDDERAENRR